MKIITPSAVSIPWRGALYGKGKTGKSRLSTSLPWGPFWGEKAVYVAADPGAEELGSVLRENRDRLIVVKPGINAKGVYDPLTEAIAIATKDWKAEYPEVGTIIWDTMTQTSYDLLEAYANSGQFSDKHITFGKPGTLEYHAIPMEGDYGGAQGSTFFIMKYLFRQPLNIIVLFHEEFIEPKNEGGGGLFGGPAIAGKAGTKRVAGMYDNLFRTTVKEIPEGGKNVSQFLVHTQQKGIWMAGYRSPLATNPIPTVKLDPNPSNFWTTYQGVVSGS